MAYIASSYEFFFFCIASSYTFYTCIGSVVKWISIEIVSVACEKFSI